jgi:hypothetical protein
LPNDETSDAFGGWVMIAAKSLSYRDIMNSLKWGDFYASCGPEIKSLVIENGVICAEFSNCVRANLITDGRRTDFVSAKQGQTITSARFTLKDTDRYFRLTVTDQTGKKAYTQIYEI